MAAAAEDIARIRASDLIADVVTGHSIDLMRVDAGLRREVLGNLYELEAELADQIRMVDPTATGSDKIRAQRARRLLKETNSTTCLLYTSPSPRDS